MSLHSVDKNPDNPNRDNPQLNVDDRISHDNRMSHNTASTSYGAPNANPIARIQQYNNYILAIDSNNLAKAMMYIDPSGNAGFKSAKSGFDVRTATDAQLTFNSAQDTLKVVQTGTIVLNKGANILFANTVVTHSLGVTPVVIASVDYGGGAYYQLPITYLNDSTGAIVELIDTIASPIDVTFEVRSPSNGSAYSQAQSFNIRYYFLQETAS